MVEQLRGKTSSGIPCWNAKASKSKRNWDFEQHQLHIPGFSSPIPGISDLGKPRVIPGIPVFQRVFHRFTTRKRDNPGKRETEAGSESKKKKVLGICGIRSSRQIPNPSLRIVCTFPIYGWKRPFPAPSWDLRRNLGFTNQSSGKNANKTQQAGKSGIFRWRLWLRGASRAEFRREAAPLAAAGGLG